LRSKPSDGKPRPRLSPRASDPLPPRFVNRLAVFADLFTHPTWSHALVLLAGAILAPGRRTVTAGPGARHPDLRRDGLPKLSFSTWWALFAPKGTPKETVDRLHAATDQALADPVLRSRLADLGARFSQPSSGRRRRFRALQKSQIEKWWPIIKEVGVKAE